jgi:hypothetical protein
VPFLFHSGYLTLDKITLSPIKAFYTNDTEKAYSYSFRLPNFEVSSSYNKDCFNVLFPMESSEELHTKGNELYEAIIKRNAESVSAILGGFISSKPYHQRPDDEKTLHAYIHLILEALGFNIISEQPRITGRLDICLELPNQVYVIIELKYCKPDNLTLEEENDTLSNWADSNLEPEVQKYALAEVNRSKLSYEDVDQILSDSNVFNLTKLQQDELLSVNARKALNADERKLALAMAVREKLNAYKIRKILLNAASNSKLQSEQIDEILIKASMQALSDIKERGYHGIIKHKAKEVIDLGLSIYEADGRVMAIFG